MTKSLTFSQLRMSFKGLLADCGIMASFGPYVTAVRSKKQSVYSLRKPISAGLQNDLTS